MSLLQEALKRKEQEEAQRKPEEGSTEKSTASLPPDDANLSAGGRTADDKNTIIPQSFPSQSMPVLAPPQFAASQPVLASAEPLAKPGRRKTSLLWVIVAAGVILIGLTVAAGFMFFIYRWLPPVKAKIGQQAYQIHSEASERVGKTDTIAAGDTNVVISQPLSADSREPADSAETMPHQFVASGGKDIEKNSTVTAARAQTVTVMQNAGLNAVQQQSAGDTERKPVFAKPAPVVGKAPPASSPAVRWPALKLTGILRGSGPAESTALINGKMISAGQTIDGVTVVEIKADGVLLKRGNEKRFLRVGATLY